MYRDLDQSTVHNTNSVRSVVRNKEHFKQNKLSGPFRQFDRITGQLIEQGQFRNGVEVGLWKVFDQDGDQQHFNFRQERIGARCHDGSFSSATGRGACSWHGGVAEWIHENRRFPVGGTGKYEPIQKRLQRAKKKLKDELKMNISKTNDQLMIDIMQRLIKTHKQLEQAQQNKQTQEKIKTISDQYEYEIQLLQEQSIKLETQNQNLKDDMQTQREKYQQKIQVLQKMLGENQRLLKRQHENSITELRRQFQEKLAASRLEMQQLTILYQEKQILYKYQTQRRLKNKGSQQKEKDCNQKIQESKVQVQQDKKQKYSKKGKQAQQSTQKKKFKGKKQNKNSKSFNTQLKQQIKQLQKQMQKMNESIHKFEQKIHDNDSSFNEQQSSEESQQNNYFNIQYQKNIKQHYESDNQKEEYIPEKEEIHKKKNSKLSQNEQKIKANECLIAKGKNQQYNQSFSYEKFLDSKIFNDSKIPKQELQFDQKIQSKSQSRPMKKQNKILNVYSDLNQSSNQRKLNISSVSSKIKGKFQFKQEEEESSDGIQLKTDSQNESQNNNKRSIVKGEQQEIQNEEVFKSIPFKGVDISAIFQNKNA